MLEYKEFLKDSGIVYDVVLAQLERNGTRIDKPTLSKVLNDEALRLLLIEAETEKAILDIITQRGIQTPLKTRCNGSKHAKQILSILDDGEVHTREELCRALNLSDSDMREELKLLKKEHPILYSPRRKGYWLSKGQPENLGYIRRLKNEYLSKRLLLNYQMRPLIAEEYKIKKVQGGE